MRVLFLLSILHGAIATNSASTVCVYNYAGFVLNWKLRNVDDDNDSSPTSIYPIGQSKCIEAADLEGVQSGAHLVPVVRAIGGKTYAANHVTYNSVNVTQVTYVCRGGTFDYSCVAEKPPPSVEEVAKHVGEFLVGFVEGLGADIGFSECLTDVNNTYKDIVEVVIFFENGINQLKPGFVIDAFKLIGKVLQDFGVAINECISDAGNLQRQFQDLADALSGDLLGTIIKVLVNEGVTIWNNRADITSDCKAVTADWNAGDFQGSGRAVGDIIGIIISGLHNEANRAAIV